MNVIGIQRQKLFFDDTPERKNPHLPLPPSRDQIQMYLHPNNATCPLNQIIVSEANEGNMRTLRLFAYDALLRPNHSCRGCNFAIYSGPGQGKSSIVRAFAETIKIPFITIQPSVSSNFQIFEQIKKAFEKFGTPLMPQQEQNQFILPPCIVFFDEAHGLSKELRREALLNAMEAKDGWMTCDSGQSTTIVDCQNVCWSAATTDPGILFKESEAFYSRLGNHITWVRAGRKEVARIIKKNFAQLPDTICELISFYQKVPRMALSFTETMIREANFSESSWEEAALKTAEISGIDEYGMHFQQLQLLKALGQHPYAKNNLIIPAQCRIEELEQMLLPPLLEHSEDAKPLVAITRKGVAITKAGLAELDKRGIPHRGETVTAERFYQ